MHCYRGRIVPLGTQKARDAREAKYLRDESAAGGRRTQRLMAKRRLQWSANRARLLKFRPPR
jgi:hypothetical protein